MGGAGAAGELVADTGLVGLLVTLMLPCYCRDRSSCAERTVQHGDAVVGSAVEGSIASCKLRN